MAALPVVWHPAYEVDIGPHVFPTRKYRLVRDLLLTEGVINESDIIAPEPIGDDDVLRVHTRDYFDKIQNDSFNAAERQQLEVPFSRAVRDAMWLCAGGTRLTGVRALDTGVGVHLGGGFHHAYPDHGEGFCLINDVTIAIRTLRAESRIERALVIDLDVHHGNGTAEVFGTESETFTFSMHQQNNYPAWKPPGNLDVGLADGTEDDEYLERLDESMSRVLEEPAPDIAFYLAGADPYMYDQLGGLSLTIEGLYQRDVLVLDRLRRAGIPAAITLAGGYAINSDDTVRIHTGTVRAAAQIQDTPG